MERTIKVTSQERRRDLLNDLSFVEKARECVSEDRPDLLREYWAISEQGWSVAIRRALVAEERLRRITEINKQTLVVWWLNRDACKALGDELPSCMPDYICEQYRLLRSTSSFKSRLFVSAEFGEITIKSWPENEMGRMLRNYNGIIVRKDSRMVGEHLPGVITDLTLARVNW